MWVEGVGGVVPVEILGGRLAEEPVDGLALGYDLEGRVQAAPALDGPAGVERAQEAAGAARARWPEWLEIEFFILSIFFYRTVLI